MKHPHYDMIVEWAKDPSRVVQYKDSEGTWLDAAFQPMWHPSSEYRFKPNQDVVRYIHIHEGGINWFSTGPAGKPNLCLTFSGEDGRLLKAEVLE